MFLCLDRDASEGTLEESAATVVSFIDCLGIGVEHVGEGTAGISLPALKLAHFIFIVNTDQEVEMITQQAESVHIHQRRKMMGEKPQEIGEIAFLHENIFAIVSPVMDVIEHSSL